MLRIALRRGSCLARLLAVTAGRATLERALPFYLGVAIAAVILFAGNGMDARTLTGEALARPGFRGFLFAAWGFAALPAARAWLLCPQAWVARALPVGRGAIVSSLALGLCALQLPWAVLWLRGAGPLAGLWAVCAAAGLQASVALVSQRVHWVSLGLALSALALGAGLLGAALAALACAVGVDRAWRSGAEGSHAGRDWIAAGGPLRAWLSALAILMLRCHAPQLHRVAMSWVMAVCVALVGLENGAGSGELGTLRACLLVSSPVAVFAVASLAGPLLRMERELAWLLHVSGAPPRVRLAPVLLMGAVTATAGLAFAVAVAGLAGWAPLAGLVLGLASSGAFGALGMAGAGLAQRTLRGDGRDAARVVFGALGSWLTLVLAILRWPVAPVALSIVAAGVLWGLGRGTRASSIGV